MTDLAPHPEFADGSFGHLRLGRVKPEEPAKLSLDPYVDEAAFVAPPSADFYSAVASWPMYGNDDLGDCTCAAAGHLVQAWSAAAGGEKTMDAADVIRMYWETGDPPSATGEAGGPTDTGRTETSVLGYWRRSGIAPDTAWVDRIIAYARVKVANQTKVKATCALLGGVYIGIGMPLTAQHQAVWDYVPDAPEDQRAPFSWGGHAVPIVGYDADYYYVVTWGALLKMTPAFYEQYVDEAYAVISSDFLGGHTETVTGLDLPALRTDLASLTAGAPVNPDAVGADLPPEEANTATAPAEPSEGESGPEDAAQDA